MRHKIKETGYRYYGKKNHQGARVNLAAKNIAARLKSPVKNQVLEEFYKNPNGTEFGKLNL